MAFHARKKFPAVAVASALALGETPSRLAGVEVLFPDIGDPVPVSLGFLRYRGEPTPSNLKGHDMNWLSDGWTDADWLTIEVYTGDALNVARELDHAVGAGGGSFNPVEAREFAERFRRIADALQASASRYL